MKKIFRICMLLFLLSLFLFTSVNAVSIDMDLGDMTPADVEGIVEEALDENIELNIDDTERDDSSPRVTTTKNTDDDEFLTVENILSIVIIVIGILLILLAIAILIRFK